MASNVNTLAVLLTTLIPAEVRRAEWLLLSDAIIEQEVAEAAMRLLLEFHQFVVEPIANIFAYALPCESALTAIQRRSPHGVVEVGAGNGLWAFLLRRRGVEVYAYDQPAHCLVPSCRHRFFEISVGGPEAAAFHPQRSLLMCWPPLEAECAAPNSGTGQMLNLFGLEALRCFMGEVLFYVGEWSGASGLLSKLSARTSAGQTGGILLQQEIVRRWALVDIIQTPRWPGFSDCLYIFTRKELDSSASHAQGSQDHLVIGADSHPSFKSNPPDNDSHLNDHSVKSAENILDLRLMLSRMQDLNLIQTTALAAALHLASYLQHLQ